MKKVILTIEKIICKMFAVAWYELKKGLSTTFKTVDGRLFEIRITGKQAIIQGLIF